MPNCVRLPQHFDLLICCASSSSAFHPLQALAEPQTDAEKLEDVRRMAAPVLHCGGYDILKFIGKGTYGTVLEVCKKGQADKFARESQHIDKCVFPMVSQSRSKCQLKPQGAKYQWRTRTRPRKSGACTCSLASTGVFLPCMNASGRVKHFARLFLHESRHTPSGPNFAGWADMLHPYGACPDKSVGLHQRARMSKRAADARVVRAHRGGTGPHAQQVAGAHRPEA